MSVMIDGVPWTSSASRSARLRTNNHLNLSGQDTTGRLISFEIPLSPGLEIPPSAAVSVSLDFGTPGYGAVTMTLDKPIWDNARADGTGSFTVTSLSESRVSGTFFVTLVNDPINPASPPTVQLTNGQFDMAMTRQ